MYRTLILTGICLSSLASGAAAQAEDDIIMVTGLRPVPLADVSASLSVLNEDNLAIRNTVYLADQLRAIPGIGVSSSGAEGGLTQLRVRGAEANHTLVLLNGIEISDPTTGETDFGLWAGIDAGRIEVLRGEQSALYGSDAIGGVINILTNKTDGTTGLIEAGSDHTLRLMGRHGVANENGYITASLSSYSTEGIDTSGTGREEDGSTAYSALVTGGTTLKDQWSLTGLLRYGEDDVETDADTDFDGRLDDSIRETHSQQFLIGTALQGDTGKINHMIRASFSDVTRDNFNGAGFTDSTTGERVKLSYSPSRLIESDMARYIFSGQIDYEKEDYQRVSTDTFFGDPNQQQSFETIGLGGEIVATWAALTVNGSLRYDDNDDRFDDAATWRLGAALPISAATRLRASVGSGVKNPTFTELFGFFPGSFTGNPNLQPEQSTSYEIGIDRSAGPLNLSATWFSAELEDEIFTQFNADFTSSPANRNGKSKRDGIELAAQWDISDSLRASASFSDISSNDDTGAQEIRVPEQTASLSLNWQSPLKDGLTFGAALDYVGEQDDFFFTFPAERVTLDSYIIATANFSYPITDRVSVTARGENIFDEEIVDVFGFEQAGARYFVGLKVR